MEKLFNLCWLTPEIFLIFSIVLLLVYGVIAEKTPAARMYSQHQKITWLSITTLIFVTLLLLCQISLLKNETLTIGYGFLSVNLGIITVKLVLTLSTLAILLMSLGHEQPYSYFEWSLLCLLSLLGMFILIGAQDLLMLYLSIELFSLSLYALASSKRSAKFSTEAGLKYFILGALSSGLLLFGMGLIYISTGHTNYIEIQAFALGGQELQSLIEIGALLIVISLLFKLAAAPFHMWAPDVYEGAPTLVTAFFSVVPKIATLTALLNLLFIPFLPIFSVLQPLIIFSALFSIIVGSLGALNQTKVKRLLAYSAISHIGFILLGFVPGSLLGLQASFLYIFIYILMTLNSFCVVLSLFRRLELLANPSFLISQFVAISRFNPALALNFSLVLLSIAGIPPLAGFMSKFLVLNFVIDAEFYLLASLSVLFSVVGSFYYLRLIKWIYFKHSPSFENKLLFECASPSLAYHSVSFFPSIIISSSLFVIITLLIYPNPFLFLSLEAILSMFI